ncbi:AEC family transporter [Azohydromonas caseinilytica]|uniref:AEC family transporter n=1 Tax=Azohydromonas caseinilytica TaxID=2728836 RepID=A0A848F3X9_9BURK|nr:AEC family transporter [Azohydromonas caseinilytica]NML13778.1 AEC family transporter [Azohydromonas caseinilytica]
MPLIINITLPFFALILCGGVAARLRWLPAGAVPGLNAFVLYFALPCMLLRFGMRTPVHQLLDPTLLALYGLCALAVVGLALRAGRALSSPDAAFGALVAAFPNSGFIGVPLVASLLGPAAAGPVIGTLLVDMTLTSSLCIALAQRGHGDWRRLLRRPLTNPLPWAIGAGALLSALQWQLPAPVDGLVRMLGDAASPVALFTVGALLAGAPAPHAGARGVLPTVGLKLLLHPALLWLGGNAAISLGLSLNRADLAALTLAAALPSASNVTLLAERYDADGGRVARIVLVSTVLAFASFSALAWYFGAGNRA